MYLTRDEEKILNGEYGEAAQLALRVIVKVGEALNAEKLIQIKHAHVSGISYNNIGEHGLNFMKDLLSKGGKFQVPTTINPIGFDIDEPTGIPGINDVFVRKQLEIVKTLASMGGKLTMTCTPYYVENIKPGWHLAWGESSAVAYANSILNAWTNREGGPLALLAGIVGRTYYAGIHLPENRIPKTHVKIEFKAKDQAYLGIIGKLVAEKTTHKPPIVTGLPNLPLYYLKTMCAAAGAAGNLEMCVLPGITKIPVSADNFLETIEIDEQTIKAEIEQYTPVKTPDLIFIGCPHVSLEEIFEVVSLFEALGNETRVKIPFWIAVSRKVYEMANQQGITIYLRNKGVRLIRDTCIVVSPGWKNSGYSVLTNSFKTAFYLKRIHGLESFIDTLPNIVKIAVKGVV